MCKNLKLNFYIEPDDEKHCLEVNKWNKALYEQLHLEAVRVRVVSSGLGYLHTGRTW